MSGVILGTNFVGVVLESLLAVSFADIIFGGVETDVGNS